MQVTPDILDRSVVRDLDEQKQTRCSFEQCGDAIAQRLKVAQRDRVAKVVRDERGIRRCILGGIGHTADAGSSVLQRLGGEFGQVAAEYRQLGR